MSYIPHSLTNLNPSTFIPIPEKNKDPVLAEKKFISAMLGRAILDFLDAGGADVRKIAKRTARGWIFRKTKKDESFSFSWICQQLDLDPIHLRKYLSEIENSPLKEGVIERIRFVI